MTVACHPVPALGAGNKADLLRKAAHIIDLRYHRAELPPHGRPWSGLR